MQCQAITQCENFIIRVFSTFHIDQKTTLTQKLGKDDRF